MATPNEKGTAFSGVYRGAAEAARNLASAMSKGRSRGIVAPPQLSPTRTGLLEPLSPVSPRHLTTNTGQVTKPVGQAPVGGDLGYDSGSFPGDLQGVMDLTTLRDKLNEPPDPDMDPEDALAEKILSYLDNLDANHAGQPGVMTTGETLALGLLAGLRPEALEGVVLPILDRERAMSRGMAQDARVQMQMHMQALGAVSEIFGRKAQREMMRQQLAATESRFQRSQAQSAELFREGQAGALQRAQTMAANQQALLGLRVPPGIIKDFGGLSEVASVAREALAFLEAHPTAAGPVGALPGAGQFSKEVAEWRTIMNRLNTTLRRENFGTAQTAQEMATGSAWIPQDIDTVLKKRENLGKITNLTNARLNYYGNLYPRLPEAMAMGGVPVTGNVGLLEGEVAVPNIMIDDEDIP